MASSSTITVVTPSNVTATTSSLVIQIQALSATTTATTLGKPSSAVNQVGATVFDVKAIVNETTILDSFNTSVTITYHYSDADVSGLDESTLRLYHYHNGIWIALDSCSVDTGANIITCTTPSFSIFSLFGQPIQVAQSTYNSNGSVSSGIHYGCKDPSATNYEYFSASKPELCRYGTGISSASTLAVGMGTTTRLSIVTGTFTRDLEKGMTGSDVTLLQQFLISKNTGPAAQKIATHGVTSYFGLLTQAAVIEYQKAQNITPAIGYLGPKTRAVMGTGK